MLTKEHLELRDPYKILFRRFEANFKVNCHNRHYLSPHSGVLVSIEKFAPQVRFKFWEQLEITGSHIRTVWKMIHLCDSV